MICATDLIWVKNIVPSCRFPPTEEGRYNESISMNTYENLMRILSWESISLWEYPHEDIFKWIEDIFKWIEDIFKGKYRIWLGEI